MAEIAEAAAQPPWMNRTLVMSAIALLIVAAAAVYLNFRPIPFDPITWKESHGITRGRMLSSLLAQTDFVGFSREDVEHNLGPADFDERQFWYDLGPIDTDHPPEPRAHVGDPTRLYAVFSYTGTGAITDVFYSYRRPILGSEPFDSTGWFAIDRSTRQSMFTKTLRRLRRLGLNRATTRLLLGPPDGSRIRAHYDLGSGAVFIGSGRALVLSYDSDDVVIESIVAD
jgi:hypothetical protein